MVNDDELADKSVWIYGHVSFDGHVLEQNYGYNHVLPKQNPREWNYAVIAGEK